MNTSVLDVDITNAFNLVEINFPADQSIWSNQSAFQTAWLYLAAHYLVLNLRASSQGIQGKFNWAQNSKGAGSVNESFSIPQRVLDNPDFMQYTETRYGAMYLQLLWPVLSGVMFIVHGSTRP